MKFKYYDLLIQTIIGSLLILSLKFLNGDIWEKYFTECKYAFLMYFPITFVIGYFIDIIGGLLEGFYYWTIGGRPSDKLLQWDSKKGYSGISKVRFYQTIEISNMLKQDVKDNNADEKKMFDAALRIAVRDDKGQISNLKVSYKFSRLMLTAMLTIAVICIVFLFVHIIDEVKERIWRPAVEENSSIKEMENSEEYTENSEEYAENRKKDDSYSDGDNRKGLVDAVINLGEAISDTISCAIMYDSSTKGAMKVFAFVLLILLSWNQYRKRAYHYAREVLNEYIYKRERNC